MLLCICGEERNICCDIKQKLLTGWEFDPDYVTKPATSSNQMVRDQIYIDVVISRSGNEISIQSTLYFHCIRMRRNLRYMHFKGFYRLSLLLLCGDIDTNPGPTKHSCGLCSRAVAKTHRAVLCETCDNWLHIKCADISPKEYVLLQTIPDPYICTSCLKVPLIPELLELSKESTTHPTCTSDLSSTLELYDYRQINDSFTPSSDEDENWEEDNLCNTKSVKNTI